MIDPTRSLLRKSPLEEQLLALTTADKVKPSTSLGFLAGKILGGGLNSWAENYADRGYIKNILKVADPDERQRLLELMKQNNPSQYERIMRRTADEGIDFGTTPQAALQPQQPPTSQLAQGVLGNDNPLTNAADRQFEALPEVTAPFQSPSNYDFSQYANILRALQRR